jgi:hypothetical protein
MVERGKRDTYSTHMHDTPLFYLATGISILKSGGVKLVLLVKNALFVK